MNKSDSERIANYLEELGYSLSEKQSSADLVVLTTCGVKQAAEDRVYGLVHKIKKNNLEVKIIITGCLSKREDVQKRIKDDVDIWLPITELDSLGEKLGHEKKQENSLSGYLNILPKYNSSFSAFVPVGNGCNNFCAYCVVPHARGREKYREASEIVDEVKSLVKRGYKEIILIAQNVNSYKSNYENRNIDFADLLKIVNDVEGDFWIRFSTSHPKDMSDKLINAVVECEKVCEHIHLPAQSGDNEILQNMNRKYTVEHYKELIKKIRKKISKVNITTDIIVGFPGETEEQFNNTAKLFEEIKYGMAYISQFSPRPGTLAMDMEDNVSLIDKKKREKDLMIILRKTALENNKEYIGEIIDILIEGKNKKGEWYGKARTSKNVKIKGVNNKCNIGEFVKVKITEVEDFGMAGEIVV